MLVNLYLLKNFSNYFNRRCIYKESLEDYLNSVEDYFIVESINFNPADGVTTSHTIGSKLNAYEKEWNPDYAIIVSPVDNSIISRWYITEFTRTMQNQYQASFKRDSIADNYDLVMYNPCYIEKGTVAEDDPAIVNNEGLSFNQIKKNEYYIKDETSTPWVVVYTAQSDNREATTIKARFHHSQVINFDELSSSEQNKILSLFPEIKTAKYPLITHDKVFNDNKGIDYKLNYAYIMKALNFYLWRRKFDILSHVDVNSYNQSNNMIGEGPSGYLIWGFATNTDKNYVASGFIGDGWNKWGGDPHPNTLFSSIFNNANQIFKNDFINFVKPLTNKYGIQYNSSSYDRGIKNYIGKIIFIKDTGMYFTIKQPKIVEQEIQDKSSIMMENIKNGILKSDLTGWETDWNQTVDVKFNYINYEYVASTSTGADITMDVLSGSQSYQTQIVPFDIICFPAFDTTIIDENGNSVECSGDAGLQIAKAFNLNEKFGTSGTYDIQMIPYCPCRELINDDGIVDLRKAGYNQSMPINTKVSSTETLIVSYGIYATDSFHSFYIDKLDQTIITQNKVDITSVLKSSKRKLDSNCDMWRLNSPNYASTFEFSVAKNVELSSEEKNIEHIKVDMTLRPYAPYIHVAPAFKFLYGSDFNDSRGLICSGDYSVTCLSSAWADYQVNNKNYENIFNRQIVNMETNRAIGRERESWGMAQSSVAAGMQIINSMNDVAMKFREKGIAGAIGSTVEGITRTVNTGMQLAGIAKNMDWNERAYQEGRSFAVDMYNMQLDNIKALPSTITKSSTLNYNYKFFPFIEYYSCTDLEKYALLSKIYYNGMTVGRIGIIADYIDTSAMSFIKGEMICTLGLGDDSHIARDIYDEINKGIFFMPEEESYDRR